jgi:hypothetical protein
MTKKNIFQKLFQDSIQKKTHLLSLNQLVKKTNEEKNENEDGKKNE